jgi:hypothetical protein
MFCRAIVYHEMPDSYYPAVHGEPTLLAADGLLTSAFKPNLKTGD